MENFIADSNKEKINNLLHDIVIYKMNILISKEISNGLQV